MKHVNKSVLLWYSPAEMYALVTAVEDYPRFMPWCERAEVLQRHEDGMTARLHIGFAGLHHAFTTRNVNVPDSEVRMTLVEGPFSELQGCWRFTPLAKPGGAAEVACKIDFSLTYSFASRPLAMVISPVFDRIANTFVDAFVKRAEQVYGPR